MVDFISNVRSKLSEFLGGGEEPSEMKQADQEYVELETSPVSESRGKITVRQFHIDNFEAVRGVLDALREGSTIALVNIKPLREKDIVELKRVISKLKKTTDAISGDIAGFSDDFIVATPSFASIHRYKESKPVDSNQPQPMSSSAIAGQEIM